MAWPHAGHFIEAIVSTVTGAPLASTSYNVYQSDGVTLATIYVDRLRTGSPVTQPLTTSTAGNAEFYTDPQKCVLVISGNNINVDVYPDVVDLNAPPGSASLSADNDFVSHILKGYLNNENVKTSGYTFVSGDSGTTFTYNSGSQGTFVLPNNLPVGWNVPWRQKGAGQMLFSAASGATLENANSHTKSRITGARGGLEVVENVGGNAAIYSLFGDTSA